MKAKIFKKNHVAVLTAILFISFSFLIACSHEQKAEVKLTSEFATISLPKAHLTANFDNKVEFIFDEESETVVKIIASNDLLRLYNMTNVEFENYVFYEMETLSDKDPKKAHDHATCMKDCWNTFTNADGTKKPGRGGCRFSCWVSTAVQIIEAVGDSIPF